MARVKDDDVASALIWARNYGEIESYTLIAPSGRKWLVRTAVQTTIRGDEPGIGLMAAAPVPSNLVFTSREALAFAYGLAIAGAHHGRQAFAAREWDW